MTLACLDCLASQSCTELGPAQPQLVSFYFVIHTILCSDSVHGQSMERSVKEVTRACESVFGEEARDGFIRAGIANRQVMPKNETKRNLARMVGSK